MTKKCLQVFSIYMVSFFKNRSTYTKKEKEKKRKCCLLLGDFTSDKFLFLRNSQFTFLCCYAKDFYGLQCINASPLSITEHLSIEIKFKVTLCYCPLTLDLTVILAKSFSLFVFQRGIRTFYL